MTEPEASYTIVRFWPGIFFGDKRSFIIASWLRTLRTGNDLYRLIDPPGYYEAYNLLIPARLNNADIRMAVLTDAPDVILGYAVYRGKTLDYWYVKPDFRKMGIGAALLPEFDTVSHVTKTWLLIWAKEKYKNVKFNPFV